MSEILKTPKDILVALVDGHRLRNRLGDEQWLGNDGKIMWQRDSDVAYVVSEVDVDEGDEWRIVTTRYVNVEQKAYAEFAVIFSTKEAALQHARDRPHLTFTVIAGELGGGEPQGDSDD